MPFFSLDRVVWQWGCSCRGLMRAQMEIQRARAGNLFIRDTTGLQWRATPRIQNFNQSSLFTTLWFFTFVSTQPYVVQLNRTPWWWSCGWCCAVLSYLSQIWQIPFYLAVIYTFGQPRPHNKHAQAQAGVTHGGSGASYKLMRTFFSDHLHGILDTSDLLNKDLLSSFRITIFIEVITNHWASRHSEQFIMTGLTHLYSWTFRSILICFVGKTSWSWHAQWYSVQCAPHCTTVQLLHNCELLTLHSNRATIRIRVRCHVPFYYLNPIVLSHSSSEPSPDSEELNPILQILCDTR